MEEEERILSDVHVFTSFLKDELNDLVYTRFHIRCHLDAEKDIRISSRAEDMEPDCDECYGSLLYCDDEGDFVLNRARKGISNSSEVITIEHHLATGLNDVGLQVWRGALLMADFILDNEQIFNGCYGLELGAGVGLCSIVLGRVANLVFCTDVGQEDILKNCQRNVEINSHLFRNSRMQQQSGCSPQDIVKVKQLDWKKESFVENEICSFNWTKEDKEQLDKVTVLIAADVIYEDHLTDALFKQVLSFLNKSDNVIFYLAIEKRINFTLEFLEISCPAYNYFIKTLEILKSESVLQARRIPSIFKQYLDYERVQELELWEIKLC